MEVLVHLAVRKGGVVTREELFAEVWDGVRVTDHVLSRCISELRKALGDDSKTPSFVETIRKRGYRLLAEVRPCEGVWPPEDPSGDDRSPAAPPSDRAPAVTPAVLVTLTLALVVVAGLVFWILRPSPAPPSDPPPREVPLTSLHGSELDPALSPDGTAMAFSWSGEDGESYDIYVKDLATEEVRRLTSDPGEDKNPCWSSDGERIAFVRSAGESSGLYVVPARGGEAQGVSPTVSGDICDLLFTPDGRALLLIDRPSPDEPFSVFRLDLLSRERTRLTVPPAHFFGDRDLAVSRDGTRLAFARAERPGIEDLYVRRIGGGEEKRLTFDRASITGLEWTADGSEILLSSGRGGSLRLWRIDAAGGKPRPIIGFGEHASDPMLALGSDRLVFERRRYEINLWVTRNDGERWTEPRPLITSTRWDWMPRFSPEGDRIAFLSDRGGDATIWLVDVDGAHPRRLGAPGELRVRSFDWSPDGTHIALEHTDEQGRSDLTLLTLEDEGVKVVVRLTRSEANETNPRFARDGRSILFVSDRSGKWQLSRMKIDGSGEQCLTRDGAIEGVETWDGRSILVRRPRLAGLFEIPTGSGSQAASGVASPSDAPPVRLAVAIPEDDGDFCASPGGIFYTSAGARPSVLEIHFHDLATGTTSNLDGVERGLGQPGGMGLAASPDGKTLVYPRTDRKESDIVMVEGFR
jgi:Tol biopolymer transport system component/DNA-binding winged helix-turn-helix (wHTH) protein